MTADRLRKFLSEFENKHILVVGDVMLDRFLWGNVRRISPEAPVPVVEVKRESHYPGGAANVARNLSPFSRKTTIMGLAGEGWESDLLINTFQDAGLSTEGIIRNPEHQTILKTRVIAQNQQVVRIDREVRKPISEPDADRAAQFVESIIEDVDAIIIEDYGKGFVTQYLVDRIAEITRKHDAIVTVDPNPNNPIEWKDATAIKPNRTEAFKVAGVSEDGIQTGETERNVIERVGRNLLEMWDTEMLLLTLGEQGMALYQQDSEPYYIPTRAREVFDVSGAGDTAIALFTLAIASGATPSEAAEISNYASGVVVGKVGTATLTGDELIERLMRE